MVSSRILKTLKTTKPIRFKAGYLAQLSDGSCVCSSGDTEVMTTVVKSSPTKDGFLPLTVDYHKNTLPGSFKIEENILISRMIDRSVRPLFPKGFDHETQIICDLIATDNRNEPDIPAINAASASLSLSELPWNGPIGAVRMSLVGDNLTPNPTRMELQNSRWDLVVAANSLGNLVMVEGSCREPIEYVDAAKGIQAGIKECLLVIESIKKLQKTFGRPKRPFTPSNWPTKDQIEVASSLIQEDLMKILSNHNLDKFSRDEAIEGVKEKLRGKLLDEPIIIDRLVAKVTRYTLEKILHETGLRCDGRSLDQLRPITCQVNPFEALHGSAIFQRGQTQVLGSTTFVLPDLADRISIELKKARQNSFSLKYRFPPYATRDIGRVNALPGRREIGHGALAEKALRPLIPSLTNQDLPIRVDCTVLESNGSSSMASVCAGSMSLMDASVKIKEHVAGVAMGLISELGDMPYSEHSTKTTKVPCSDKYHILTDILGFEDFIGDMDLKVAGTRKAITAIQMDVKATVGLPPWIFNKGLQKAQPAIAKIITKMEKAIREPRNGKKSSHPVIKFMYVGGQKIGSLRSALRGGHFEELKKLGFRIAILDDEYSNGPDGMLDEKQEKFSDDHALDQGKQLENVIYFAPDDESMKQGEAIISSILINTREREPEFGSIQMVTVDEIKPNGVWVTLNQNKKAVFLGLHELDIQPVMHPSVLNWTVGQQIQVKYLGRDGANGRIRISRKALLISSSIRTSKANLHDPR